MKKTAAALLLAICCSCSDKVPAGAEPPGPDTAAAPDVLPPADAPVDADADAALSDTPMDTAAAPDTQPDTAEGADTALVPASLLPAASLSLRLKGRKGDLVEIEIVANEIPGVFGVAALLTYDPAALGYQDTHFSTEFGDPWEGATYMAAELKPGRLTLGIASTAFDAGVDLGQAAPLAVVSFKVKNGGKTPLGFFEPKCLVLDTYAQPVEVSYIGAVLSP